MPIETRRFTSADIKLVGYFNPKILRDNFLKQSCGLDFGEVVEASPDHIPVVSELRYGEIRWFMDYDKMIVQNLRLRSLEDFTAPEFAAKYLEILAYTPLIAAGLNLHVEFEVSSPIEFWRNLADPVRILSSLGFLEARSAEITSTQRQTNGAFDLKETTIRCLVKAGDRIQFKFTKPEMGDVMTGHYNYEVRQLDVNREKLLWLAEQRMELAHAFLRILDDLAKGAAQ